MVDLSIVMFVYQRVNGDSLSNIYLKYDMYSNEPQGQHTSCERAGTVWDCQYSTKLIWTFLFQIIMANLAVCYLAGQVAIPPL